LGKPFFENAQALSCAAVIVIRCVRAPTKERAFSIPPVSR
jgi:hypothetical protein